MRGKHIVISILLCALTISLGIIVNVTYYDRSAAEEKPAEEKPAEEELVEKVRDQERRLIRLELIISRFKALGEELNDPMLETDIDAEVDKLVDAEPEKANIVGTGILIGALILLVVGIAVLTIRLSRR